MQNIANHSFSVFCIFYVCKPMPITAIIRGKIGDQIFRNLIPSYPFLLSKTSFSIKSKYSLLLISGSGSTS
ncbi:MAG: hypothetical protein EBX50_11470 [Chitinophagia bacterium]|nr:hypothetical protein [Chitinophagia bacterium]